MDHWLETGSVRNTSVGIEKDNKNDLTHDRLDQISKLHLVNQNSEIALWGFSGTSKTNIKKKKKEHFILAFICWE